MPSNINGNALTLEQKVYRAFESEYNLEGSTPPMILATFERLSNSQVLNYISNALEEMFEPIGSEK